MSKSRKKGQTEKLKDFEGWSKEFRNESDRATAILGVALADAVLEKLLREFLVDDENEVNLLLEPDKPLGTFSSRSRMAYCLGLISNNHFKDLLTIGKIRNRFAHNLHGLDFEHPDISHLCGNLITPKALPVGKSLNNRSRYIITVYLVHYHIVTIRTHKCKIRNERKIQNP